MLTLLILTCVCVTEMIADQVCVLRCCLLAEWAENLSNMKWR